MEGQPIEVEVVAVEKHDALPGAVTVTMKSVEDGAGWGYDARKAEVVEQMPAEQAPRVGDRFEVSVVAKVPV